MTSKITRNYLPLAISIICVTISLSPANCQENVTLSNKKFPNNFKFGCATASYQVEGAWNVDGKGENIWDRLAHTNSTSIANEDNGDIACDSYNKYKEDVALLKSLGADYYRFSFSWSRIFPYGFTYKINEDGVTYYKNLINELLANDIEPLPTLFHWDTPQPLQDIGGWTNEKIVEPFAQYARFVFETFGDNVTYWNTFNEIKQICQMGYGSGTLAPMIQSPGVGEYMCTHNVLKAHARAYHIYDEEFRSTQNGKISFTTDSEWWEPATNSTEDEEAAETVRQFVFGWFVNPIVHGNYPQVMIDRIAYRSQLEGFKKSRLPEFTQEEIDYIKGTYDYISLNTYTTSLVTTQQESPAGVPNFFSDIGVHTYQPDDWRPTIADWLKIVPWGMRKLLKWIKDTYNNPEIVVTENGLPDNGTTNDVDRLYYIQTYMSNVLDAIYEDEVNVTRYTLWSLIDNFEWTSGYTKKYGIYSVDFNDPKRTRSEKLSTPYFRKVLQTRCLVDECVD